MPKMPKEKPHYMRVYNYTMLYPILDSSSRYILIIIIIIIIVVWLLMLLLITACRWGHLEVAKFLISKGADVSIWVINYITSLVIWSFSIPLSIYIYDIISPALLPRMEPLYCTWYVPLSISLSLSVPQLSFLSIYI